MLVGTWAAATWAIRFYEHHGFRLLAPQSTRTLLATYWRISERQMETSVVLANPPYDAGAEADELVILQVPAMLFAIGEWYERFEQLEDDEVCRILELHRRSQAAR